MKKPLALIVFFLLSIFALSAEGRIPTKGKDYYVCDFNKERLMNSRATTSDEHWKVSSTISHCFDESNIGKDAWMMTADGQTQLKVTLDYEGADSRYTISGQSVQFYFYEGDDFFNDEYKEQISDTDLYIGDYTTEFSDRQASVTITVPDKYPISTGSHYTYYVVIKVKFKNGGTASVAKNIGVCRPGVIILHGLNDSSETFKTMKDYLVSSGRWLNASVLTKDYSATNTSSFYANTHQNQVVRVGLYELSNNLFYEGIASTKYDMIGHSMGGILERLYIQEVDNEHTNKLITLNSPHFGAPLGNVAPVLFYYLDHLPLNILTILTNMLFNPTGGRQAVSDLAIGSDAIRNLNSNGHRLHGIPVFAIGTCLDNNLIPTKDVNTYPSQIDEETTFLLAHIFYNEVPRDKYNFLFADDVLGDGVVSINSQFGGLSSNHYSLLSGKPGIPFTSVGGALHICSPKWEYVLDKIESVLLTAPDSNIFSVSGFGGLPQNIRYGITPKETADYITDFAEPNAESYIKLSAEFDTMDESICHTSIDCSSDMITTMVFSFLSPDKIIASYDCEEATLNLLEEYESITLYAIGRTSYNALVIDTVTLDRANQSGINDIKYDASGSEFRYSIEDGNLIIDNIPNNSILSIHNLAGTKVAEYRNNDTGHYDVSSLGRGFYIATINSIHESHSFKFSK